MKLKTQTHKLAAAFAVLLSTAIAGPAHASPWRDDRPITVGHRGTTVLADENTLAAYQVAFEHGLDAFECDPRLTADGVYAIMHDETVDRTTDGTGKIADLSLEEIKRLRTAGGHQVPTLVEALDFARDHGMAVYLDLKEAPPDGGARLVEIIRSAKMIERVIAGCYSTRMVKLLERLEPALSTCVSWPYPAPTFARARRLGADAIGTLLELAGPAAIRRAHRHGLRVITMPINDPAQIDQLRRRGVDAIQVDDPSILD